MANPVQFSRAAGRDRKNPLTKLQAKYEIVSRPVRGCARTFQ